MSFRIEDKLLINKNQLFEFKNYLINNSGKVLFPKRRVQSLYFDNYRSQMHIDSEEGCVPRKKIRIRNYPKENINLDYNFEIKISSIEGRFKKSKFINILNYNKVIKRGYIDRQYGLCLPNTIINYYREYFEVFNSRITIDTHIYYQRFGSTNEKINDDEIVVEIKTDNTNDLNDILTNFPFQRIRFSKYSRSLNYLNLINFYK